jgi:hypothetical protein
LLCQIICIYEDFETHEILFASKYIKEQQENEFHTLKTPSDQMSSYGMSDQ